MRTYWRKFEARVWSGLMEWETRGTVSDTKRGYETSVTDASCESGWRAACDSSAD